MEQVVRYSKNFGGIWQGEEKFEHVVKAVEYDKLAADHARCVQDVRRMALEVQARVANCVEDYNAKSLIEIKLEDNETWQDQAQRVLETWKEGV